MSLEQLKKETEMLSFAEKGQLIAYLLHLRYREDPTYLAEMPRRLEDRDESHWLTLEEMDNRLDLSKSAE